MTTIGSSVLISCTLIGPMVWCAIALMSSTLAPEENRMEATHACVLVVKSGGPRGGSFDLTKLYLMIIPEDTLKA